MIFYLAGLAVVLGYSVDLYLRPFTDCRWCKGTGRNKLSNRRRYGNCWNPRCQRGTVQRTGSKNIHRAVRALIAYVRNSRQNRK